MKKQFYFFNQVVSVAIIITSFFVAIGCTQASSEKATQSPEKTTETPGKPEYFLIRPEVEKTVVNEAYFIYSFAGKKNSKYKALKKEWESMQYPV